MCGRACEPALSVAQPAELLAREIWWTCYTLNVCMWSVLGTMIFFVIVSTVRARARLPRGCGPLQTSATPEVITTVLGDSK